MNDPLYSVQCDNGNGYYIIYTYISFFFQVYIILRLPIHTMRWGDFDYDYNINSTIISIVSSCSHDYMMYQV